MADYDKLSAFNNGIDKVYEKRAQIGPAFRSFYEERGFVFTPEQPPYPSPDSTVMFVGAQISLWKPILDDISSGEIPALITPQDCIRVQNKDIFYTDQDLKFCSYFRTQGAISKAEDFDFMVCSAVDFLESIGIERERVVIKVAEDQSRDFTIDSEVHVQTEEDSYYSWTYGEDDLSGRGITLALKDNETDKLWDIGNIILVSRNGQPLVTEWGFGEETLLAAIYSEGPPVLYSDIPGSIVEKMNNQNAFKYVDSLMTAMVLARLGVRPGDRGESAILDDYIRAAAFHGVGGGYSYRDILKDGKSIADHLRLGDEKIAIMQRLEYYIGRVTYAYETLPEATNTSEQEIQLTNVLHLNNRIVDAIKRCYK